MTCNSNIQYSEPITTEKSAKEGRLKVDVKQKKKKLLKLKLSKYE